MLVYLGITPLWNPTPNHVAMCSWLGFRPIYFYTTLRVKSTIIRWPLVTLSTHIKSAVKSSYPAHKTCSFCTGSMLVHCLCHEPSYGPPRGERVVFTYLVIASVIWFTLHAQRTWYMGRCRVNVDPGSVTSAQHWISIGASLLKGDPPVSNNLLTLRRVSLTNRITITWNIYFNC